MHYYAFIYVILDDSNALIRDVFVKKKLLDHINNARSISNRIKINCKK